MSSTPISLVAELAAKTATAEEDLLRQADAVTERVAKAVGAIERGTSINRLGALQAQGPALDTAIARLATLEECLALAAALPDPDLTDYHVDVIRYYARRSGRVEMALRGTRYER